MERPHLRIEEYTVGWVCALPIELAAAKVLLDEKHSRMPHDGSNDTNSYTLGRIGNHNVVIACLPAGLTGTTSAATVAMQMKSKFTSIRFSLLVGVGGGVPSNKDVRLGDVVISQPEGQHGGVVQYDFGKEIPGEFIRTGFLNKPPTVLLNTLSDFQSDYLLGLINLTEKCLSSFGNIPHFARNNAGPDILLKPNYKHKGGDACEGCGSRGRIERPPLIFKRLLRFTMERLPLGIRL